MAVMGYRKYLEMNDVILEALDYETKCTEADVRKRHPRLPLTIYLQLYHLEHVKEGGPYVHSRLRAADGVRVYWKARK